MLNFHKNMLVVVMVILILAYIGGAFNAFSPFMDINDIIEITHCTAYYAEDCDMPPSQVAFYFMPLHLWAIAPSTLIGWLLVIAGWRKYVSIVLALLPWLWFFGFQYFKVATDLISLDTVIWRIMIYFCPLLFISKLHFFAGNSIKSHKIAWKIDLTALIIFLFIWPT